MKYKIKYTYKTVNSYNICLETNYLELEFNNLDVAKSNLKRIKEHYLQYEKLNDFYNEINVNEILESNKDKDWFVSKVRYIA
jgi:hypothetical protein